MSEIVRIETAGWGASTPPVDGPAALERGDVVFFPHLAFTIADDERALFSSQTASGAKNVSFDPASGRLGGTEIAGPERDRLVAMIARFSAAARRLVEGLLPAYRGQVAIGRASFRPVEIAGRATSWRKDDTRLHVDAFPATPVQGRRILRVFTNVNPAGTPRVWRIGGDFDALAERFAPALRLPLPGSGRLRHLLHLTKSWRSPYDALMLQLHDRMKQDDRFQAESPQLTIDFPAGSTWIAFTDAVSHAAMSGQFQLEQTFLVPIDAMREPSRSPLRVLERIKGRGLA
jgi:hypothetical protein